MRRNIIHILCFTLVLLFAEQTLAQNEGKLINLPQRELSGLKIIRAIREQTGLRLNYAESLNTKLTVPIASANHKLSVKNALELVRKETGLNYEIDKEYITLTQGDASKPVTQTGKQQAVQQKSTLSGQVLDVNNNGEPLAGATVKIVELNQTTMSGAEGQYRFTNVPAGQYTLQVTYMGLAPQHLSIEIVAGKEAVYNVELQGGEGEAIDEVVVVGYGVQKRASVTGSVASIKGDQLVTVKTANVSNMLAGKLPGLRAVQRSGAPGDDGATVDIRGYGNMLVIVDGIERDYSQVNPNDIESISILKDGSAAVYGFKGANGVLLVTTKQGKNQDGKINYNGYVSQQRNTRTVELMTPYEYASLYNEAILNTSPWTGLAAYSNEELEKYKSGALGANWWDETIRSSAPQTSHTLSASGGNEKIGYYVSGGYLSQGGILRSGDWNYKQFNVRSNIKAQIKKGLDVELRLSGNTDTRLRPYEADNLFQYAQMAIPTYSLYANGNPDYWQSTGNSPNVVQMSYIDQAGYDNRWRREFNSSATINWQVPWVKGLSAKALIAYDYRNKEWKKWGKEAYNYNYNAETDEYTKVPVRGNSNLESRQENYLKPTYQYSLNYANVFGEKHDVGAMLLWEMYDDRTTDVKANRFFDIGLIDDIKYGDQENMTNDGSTKETAHAGLVGRFNYAYDSRYLLEFNFRYDGTYKYRKQDRWGFFPGVLAGWRLSEESFFKNLNTGIDNFKIRGSYAIMGDEGDYDPFQYLSGYKQSGNYILGTEGLTTGYVSTGMANPWLTWYESKTFNVGFEGSYKHGLLSVEFDWFRRHRTGLPAKRTASLPSTFGESLPEENLNSDINKGFELVVGHKYHIGEFNYSVSANFSTTRIYDDYVERATSTNMYDNWRNNTTERYKDIRWGRKVVGQFTSFEEILSSPIQDGNGNKSLLPGDLKFEDYNHDGIIDGNDSQPLGHGDTPRMYYGLNLGGSYRGFDLTVFFQGAAGHDVYISGDVMDTFIQQGLGNGLAMMTNRWHRADPTDPYSEWIPGLMPAARVAGQSDNRSDNSWSLHKADYVRLKTLELGYTLPKNLLERAGIDRLRFYVSANNLLTFNNNDGLMKYIDPESKASALRYYPQQKTFNIGVDLTF